MNHIRDIYGSTYMALVEDRLGNDLGATMEFTVTDADPPSLDVPGEASAVPTPDVPVCSPGAVRPLDVHMLEQERIAGVELEAALSGDDDF